MFFGGYNGAATARYWTGRQRIDVDVAGQKEKRISPGRWITGSD